jgi:hypothetical protein
VWGKRHGPTSCLAYINENALLALVMLCLALCDLAAVRQHVTVCLFGTMSHRNVGINDTTKCPVTAPTTRGTVWVMHLHDRGGMASHGKSQQKSDSQEQQRL